MPEGWQLLFVGVVLIVFGWCGTHISGAMPGARPLHPMPRRVRVILIAFGAIAIALGVSRLP